MMFLTSKTDESQHRTVINRTGMTGVSQTSTTQTSSVFIIIPGRLSQCYYLAKNTVHKMCVKTTFTLIMLSLKLCKNVVDLWSAEQIK